MSRNIRWSLNIWPYILAVFLVLMSPRIESYFFPVVTNFAIQEMNHRGNDIHIKGQLLKERSCTFIGVSAILNTKEGPDLDANLVFLDNPVSNTAQRPTGLQAWGPWKITIPAVPAVGTVQLVSTHQCHFGLPVRTTLVTIPVL